MSAGLYVHLPYCASRCGYCAFVVTTDSSSATNYLDAISREADLVAPEARGARFDSVYLGGGTPSLLSGEQIGRLMARLRGAFDVAPGAEVTLEANPEDVSEERRGAWRDAGVTRVSVGVQSFEDRELSAVGRRHDAARAASSLAVLVGTGLAVSGDLILGLPDQTVESFRRSVASLVGSGVDHVSIYLLEAEKSKSLEEDRRLRPARYLDDDAQAALWLEAGERLAAAGFEHYEISNWARASRRSRHNVKYWEREPTLGLGVSAHELWGERRRANVSGIGAYLAALAKGDRPTALDHPLSESEREAEEIMLGLRLSAGVDRRLVEAWIAGRGDATLSEDWDSWSEAGWILREGERVALSERGFLVSNEILCRFL